jgi:hypothetical protein
MLREGFGKVSTSLVNLDSHATQGCSRRRGLYVDESFTQGVNISSILESDDGAETLPGRGVVRRLGPSFISAHLATGSDCVLEERDQFV